jgi:hypothetical protein
LPYNEGFCHYIMLRNGEVKPRNDSTWNLKSLEA